MLKKTLARGGIQTCPDRLLEDGEFGAEVRDEERGWGMRNGDGGGEMRG